jgi:drug/metabolite transporter (DMT)-like permease
VTRTVWYLIVLVLSGTAGDLSITRVMKQVGPVENFRPSTILRCFASAMQHAWMWMGIGLHACAFVAFLALLSWADVSFVVPASAASYVAGVAGARLFLRETITLGRWAGVVLISSGVVFVLIG